MPLAGAAVALLSSWPFARPIQAAPSPSTPAPAFKDVAAIFQQKCLACHSSAAKMGGFILQTYDSMMKGGAHGKEIVPGDSAKSRMILMLEGKIEPRMPFGGDPLPATELATIRAWIDRGAPAPAAGEALAPIKGPAIPDLKPQVPVLSPVGSIAFSPDGKLLAVGGYEAVRLLDGSTGKVLATLTGQAGLVRSLAFRPDGKWLAAAGGLSQRWGEVKIWDIATRRLLRTLRGHTDSIYSVAFSPDGKLLATGSYDRLAILWNAATGEQARTLKDHIDAVFAVAFSPDGKWLATGSQDRTVKIWNVATGERLYTLSDALDGINAIAFSPSGKEIAGGGYDKSIYVWSLTDTGGKLVQSLIADEDSILEINWSPDAKEIITSSADGSIRVRDATTLDPIRVISGQTDWVEAMSLSADGKRLAAGRYDGTMSVYSTGSFEPVLGPVVAFQTVQPEKASRLAAVNAPSEP